MCSLYILHVLHGTRRAVIIMFIYINTLISLVIIYYYVYLHQHFNITCNYLLLCFLYQHFNITCKYRVIIFFAMIIQSSIRHFTFPPPTI
jgi:hypothetical protein